MFPAAVFHAFRKQSVVVAFICHARAIQWLAHQIYIIRSCYYDDYVNVSPEDRAKASEENAMLLDLLGWRYDRDGSKSDSMFDQVSSLGVEFNPQESGKGIDRFQHSEPPGRDLGEH